MAIIALLVMVAGRWYLLLAASRPVTVGPATTWLSGPLNEDGTVDYVSALEERLSKKVTHEKNAAALLFEALGPRAFYDSASPAQRREILARLGIRALDESGDYFVSFDEFVRSESAENRGDQQQGPDAPSKEREPPDIFKLSEQPWAAVDEPLVARWLMVNEKPLAIVAAACERPRLHVPLVPPSDKASLLECLAFNNRALDDAAHALACRAMMHVEAGRLEAALRDAEALHRLARLAYQQVFLSDYLRALRHDERAFSIELAIVRSQRVDGDLARRMLEAHRRLHELDSLDGVVYGERIIMLDSCLRIIRGVSPAVWGQGADAIRISNIDGDALLRHANTWYVRMSGPVDLEVYAERQHALQQAGDDLEEMIRDSASSNKSWRGKLRHALRTPRGKSEANGVLVANMILAEVCPAFSHIDGGRVRLLARGRLARLAVALAAFRVETGEYPESLSQLVPEYLAAIPIDPYSGQALRYHALGDACRVYSVGANLRDDGGEAASSEDRKERDPPDDIAIDMPAASS